MALKTANVKLNDAEVKRIYFGAFPKEERMPFSMMVAMSKLWNTNFWAFYDKDVLCGFVYTAVNRKLVFIMFLAVDEALRSQGYGSAMLQKISKNIQIKRSSFPLSLAIIPLLILKSEKCANPFI